MYECIILVILNCILMFSLDSWRTFFHELGHYGMFCMIDKHSRSIIITNLPIHVIGKRLLILSKKKNRTFLKVSGAFYPEKGFSKLGDKELSLIAKGGILGGSLFSFFLCTFFIILESCFVNTASLLPSAIYIVLCSFLFNYLAYRGKPFIRKYDTDYAAVHYPVKYRETLDDSMYDKLLEEFR